MSNSEEGGRARKGGQQKGEQKEGNKRDNKGRRTKGENKRIAFVGQSFFYGTKGARTHDLSHVKRTLSQLSYDPTARRL